MMKNVIDDRLEEAAKAELDKIIAGADDADVKSAALLVTAINEREKLLIEENLESSKISVEELKNQLERRRQNLDAVKIGVGVVTGVAGGITANHIMNKTMVFEETGCFRTAASKMGQKFTEPFIKMWTNVLTNLR